MKQSRTDYFASARQAKPKETRINHQSFISTMIVVRYLIESKEYNRLKKHEDEFLKQKKEQSGSGSNGDAGGCKTKSGGPDTEIKNPSLETPVAGLLPTITNFYESSSPEVSGKGESESFQKNGKRESSQTKTHQQSKKKKISKDWWYIKPYVNNEKE